MSDIAREEGGRPVAVTILGVLWLLVALLMFASSAMGLVLWTFGGVSDDIAIGTNDNFPSGFGIFRYYGLLVTFQLVASIAVASAAIALLRMLGWARRALRIFSWLGLVLLVVMSIAQSFLFSDMFVEAGQDALFFVAFFIVALLAGILFMGAPLVMTIWALGRPTVVNAFERK